MMHKDLINRMLKSVFKILGDYVVERGESGDWKYEKKASGKIDLFYYKRSETWISHGSSFGGYVTRKSFTFPAGLLISCEGINVTGYAGTGIGIGFPREWDHTGVQAFILSNNVETTVHFVSLHVWGTWK